MSDVLNKALEKQKSGVDFAMITVVEVFGSVPAQVGSKMIVMEDETHGTVGGGSLEKDAIEQAISLIENRGKATLVRIDVAVLDVKQAGTATLFIEPFLSAQRLWIFGGGHVAKALVPIAASVGFAVTVVDNRPEFADANRFPDAGKVVCAKYAETAQTVPTGSFVVIMTHGHSHDETVLTEAAALEPSLPYIGMIGSTEKVPAILKNLKRSGIEPGPNIYSPIGLELGGRSPQEIALSIASELLGVFHGKRHLPHCRERIKKG
ncbi:MAG: hypothetical protein GY847_22065 [Proteobacteria bacterium]|nr:hypothetical protein [Pseudomonadota bacterium]